jgi:multidrug resistance efflux pump
MRVQNRTRGSLEEEAEMLPQEPPPFVVRGMAWLLILLFFIVLAAAVVVRVPETVRCPFVLVPKDGADPIQASSLVVVREVRVTEGQEVAEGEKLFVLQSDDVRTRHTQFKTLSEELQTREKSCTNIEASYEAQLGIKKAEITQVERELVFRRKHAETIRGLVARLEKLAVTGGISQIELAKYQLELAGSEKDLSVTEKTLEGVKLERERLETDRARQRAEEQAVMQNLKVRIAALERDLENAREDLLEIRAPYASIVISLAQRSAGNVVQSGQELCQLARLDAAPRARLLLQERGLSRLAAGQRVRLFFEAFPYQRFGTITGRLDWISPAAVTSTDGSRFVALASLDQTSIRVKGELRPLRVGMKGEARVIVGSRRLIEYAFEPVRKLREDMQP